MMSSADSFPVPAGRSPLGRPGGRLVFLPDPRVTSAAPLLEERLESAGRQVTAENFQSLLDSLMERLIADAFLDVKASTGLILLRSADGGELTVAHQIQAGAEGGSIKPVCGHSLPAGTGRRGLVLASQQPFCGNDQGDDPLRENSLAMLLECVIHAEIIVPFYFARQFKGLIVALQTVDGLSGQRGPGEGTFAGFGAPVPSPAAGEGFSPRCLEEMELMSTCLGRLLDYQLICSALGMSV
ncbi:MAG: hypothetical protein JWM59_3443 [Verrucomicrobiales bacterium]|nr:hypothetical protein [Verrucomicrobiales bacterium]